MRLTRKIIKRCTPVFQMIDGKKYITGYKRPMKSRKMGGWTLRTPVLVEEEKK